MDEKPLAVAILLTVLGLWIFYQGVRIGIVKRYNGGWDTLLGIVLMIAALFPIRHGNIVPPLSEILEPFLSFIWTVLTQVWWAVSGTMKKILSFDVETLSK